MCMKNDININKIKIISIESFCVPADGQCQVYFNDLKEDTQTYAVDSVAVAAVGWEVVGEVEVVSEGKEARTLQKVLSLKQWTLVINGSYYIVINNSEVTVSLYRSRTNDN